VAIFAALFTLTVRRGATDPECGMKVDRAAALKARTENGRVVYFCSPACLAAFEAREGVGGRVGPPDPVLPAPHAEQDGADHDLGECHGCTERVAGATAERGADV